MCPHPLHKVDDLRAPLLPQAAGGRSSKTTDDEPTVRHYRYGSIPLAFVTDDVIDGMLVHSLPGELLVGQVPLEHLPEHHRAREHIHLVIILRVWVPELRSLPVHGPHETADHRPRGLLNLGQPKVGDFRDALVSDEDVRRFAVPVDDGRLAGVQIG